MKTILPLLAIIIISTGCEKKETTAPPQKHKSYQEIILNSIDTPIGLYQSERFKIQSSGQNIILCDGSTANTWLLRSGETNWIKLPNPMELEYNSIINDKK